MRLSFIFALCILPHGLFSATTRAGILIDNLGQSAAGTTAVNGPLGAAESWTAIRFTTGTGTWQFNSITARFRDDSSLTPDGLQIEVRADAGTNPDTVVVGTLTSTMDIVGEANYSFSPLVPFTLDGQMSYWLVAKPTNTNSLYGWFLTTSGTDNGQSGWSLADDYLGTANSGTLWTAPLPAVPILSIDATQTLAAVPEPTSVAIVSLYFLGFSIRRRLRHSTK